MGNEHDLQIARGAAEVIKRLMAEQGVSNAELARRTNRSASYVSQVLNPGSYSKGTPGPQGPQGTSGFAGSSSATPRTNIPTPSAYENFADALGSSLDLQATWTVTPKPGTGKLVPKDTRGGYRGSASAKKPTRPKGPGASKGGKKDVR